MAKKTKKTKPKKTKKLLRSEGSSPRDARWDVFILEYTKDFNATRSYQVAYPNVSYDSAKACATRLLTNVYIKGRVREIVAERKARILIQGDDLLLKIQEQAVADPRRLFDEDGNVLPVDQWPDDLAGTIAGFECKETYNPFTGEKTGYIKKIKFWDKPKSQELLGKNQKLFGDGDGNNVNITVVTADEAQVREALKKIQDDC